MPNPTALSPILPKPALLWEIASALGDPVAMCFNASLYEHGLGVPKHRDLRARSMSARATPAAAAASTTP